ncbi:MAG TPA: AAA family ATPase [Bacteroidales bacterium]|nr:AAA family ATPase [Bacteroidales bacterium]
MSENYISRFIDEDLQEWAGDKNRKPLLLRGARQVGKTSAVRKLAESFENYMEVNFEEHPEVHKFFENNLSPDEIIENLSVYFNIQVKENKTLVFFDEIQSCRKALLSLRYFYEKKPVLHLIAAGSLLEFAIQSMPSYGIGRIRSMFMFPFTFDEFLMAIGEESLLKKRKTYGVNMPLNEVFHNKLVRLLKKFIILGGMPEVVKKYAEGENIIACQRVLGDLVISYLDDFAKYKTNVPASRISEVFRSVVHQMGNKFVYSRVSADTKHHQIKDALELLIKAGLVITATHSSGNGIPLGAEIKPTLRKMLPFDTGIALYIAGADIKELLVQDDVDFIHKGAVAELFAGLEILKASSPYKRNELFYWQREALNSSAEVDYLIQKGNKIVPVEVKAGTKGSMQSLFLFLNEKNITKGIRLSLENFGKYDRVEVIPLYAVRDFFHE